MRPSFGSLSNAPSILWSSGTSSKPEATHTARSAAVRRAATSADSVATTRRRDGRRVLAPAWRRAAAALRAASLFDRPRLPCLLHRQHLQETQEGWGSVERRSRQQAESRSHEQESRQPAVPPSAQPSLDARKNRTPAAGGLPSARRSRTCWSLGPRPGCPPARTPAYRMTSMASIAVARPPSRRDERRVEPHRPLRDLERPAAARS